MALWHFSEALAACGRVADGLDAAEQALAIAERLGHRGWTATALRAPRYRSPIQRRARGGGGRVPSLLGDKRAPALVRVLGALVLIPAGRLGEAAEHVDSWLGVGPPLGQYGARLARCELAATRAEPDAGRLIAEAMGSREGRRSPRDPGSAGRTSPIVVSVILAVWRYPIDVPLDARRVRDTQLLGQVVHSRPRHVDRVLQEPTRTAHRPDLEREAQPMGIGTPNSNQLTVDVVQVEEPLQLGLRQRYRACSVRRGLLIRQELNRHGHRPYRDQPPAVAIPPRSISAPTAVPLFLNPGAGVRAVLARPAGDEERVHRPHQRQDLLVVAGSRGGHRPRLSTPATTVGEARREVMDNATRGYSADRTNTPGPGPPPGSPGPPPPGIPGPPPGTTPSP
jgi:hypothetical protein